MKLGEIRYLEDKEEISLPFWTKILTEKRKEKYILNKRPFCIFEEEDVIKGVLSLHSGQGLPSPWRKKAEEMLNEMKTAGAAVLLPPASGETPEGLLPVARGRYLTAFFAFEGAFCALKKQGKNPHEAVYVIIGDDSEGLSMTLAGIGDYVNHLGIFTPSPSSIEAERERLFEERGLSAEVFSSVNNPVLAEADAVIICSMAQPSLENVLKRYAVVIDGASNKPLIKRIAQRRWDIAAADGFYFSVRGCRFEPKMAEAHAFLNNTLFRGFWLEGFPPAACEKVFLSLKNGDISVKGFSFLSKEVNIPENRQ